MAARSSVESIDDSIVAFVVVRVEGFVDGIAASSGYVDFARGYLHRKPMNRLRRRLAVDTRTLSWSR